MGKLLDLALYNPSRLADEDFLAGFVARQTLADRILAKLRDIKSGGLAQHRLIVGQRGMGKTSLLRRIALGVRHDPELASVLIPLTFREEQYNVHSLHVLWCNCLDALGDFFEMTGQPEKAARIDREVAALAREKDPDGSRAYEVFREWLKNEGRRALLLIDNLDIVVAGLAKSEWSLRRILQQAGGIVVIGASTSALEAAVDPKEAFYDFFHVDVLERLEVAEVFACLRRLADLRGESGQVVRRLLANDPARIQVLHDLTGGNPRTLAMLYLVLEATEDDDVMSDLEKMLDQATPLYKARVEELAPQARVVFDAVALHWDPATSADLAAATRLETNAVSTQLDRLVRDGVVEKTSLSTTRRTGFQVAERFFNIWYLMRHGPRRQRQRLKWLAEALRRIYTPAELEGRARKILAVRGKINQGAFCLAVSDAIDDENLRSSLVRRAFQDDPRLRDEGHSLDNTGANESSVEELAIPLRAMVLADPGDVSSWARLGQLLHSHPKHREEAERALRAALELDPSLTECWLQLGQILWDADRDAEAAAALERATASDPLSLPAWNLLATVLRYLKRLEEAAAAFRKAIALAPTSVSSWDGLGSVLKDLKLFEEAESAFRRAVELDPDHEIAWGNLGSLLQDLNRLEEADRAFRRAVEIDPDYAWAWCCLGSVLHKLERFDESQRALRRAVEIDPDYTWAWGSLGSVLKKLERFDESQRALRRAVEIDPDYEWAWAELGSLLQDLRLFDQAEVALRRAIEIDPGYEWAWVVLGLVLQDLERFAEAEAAFRRAIELDSGYGWAWSELGSLLQKLERVVEAEVTFRKAVEIDPTDPWSWSNLAWLLSNSHRLDEAESAFRRAIALEPSHVSAITGLGDTLLSLGRLDEAEAALRTAISMDHRSPTAWPRLGQLMIFKGDFAEAEEALKQAVQLDPKDSYTWNSLGSFLADQLFRPSEAEHAFRQGLSVDPDNEFLHSNLAYLLIGQKRLAEAEAHFARAMKDLPGHGAGLLRAFLHLAQETLGDFLRELESVLKTNHFELLTDFRDDLLRCLRLAAAKGWGDRVLEWLNGSEFGDQYRPVWVAFDAYLHGEARLMDVNPEVRAGARRLLNELAGSRSRETNDPKAKAEHARPAALAT